MDAFQMNGGTLAFVGDAVWSLMVREHLVNLGYGRLAELQKRTIPFVSANGQANIIESLIEKEWLTETELEVFTRGRNFKGNTKAKNADIVTYRIATGFEALVGYLHLTDQKQRLAELFTEVLKMEEFQ